MRPANCFNGIAFRAVCALITCLCFAFPAWSDVRKDRKAAAKRLATEIERAQFHKVYVIDFLDSTGARTEKGCYFASAFSTLLSEGTYDLAVVNRIQAQRQLNELHISPQDLQQPEILSKAAQALGADGVLMGSASISTKDARLSLSLRDAASGREVHAMDYRERLEPTFEGSFPATENEGGIYYFAGLDGVSQPKCIYCPNPDYTDEARRNGIQGSVLLSARIDEKGKIKEARVISSPDGNMSRLCLNTLRDWRMKASQDVNGNAVSVRTAIEMVFRLLN